MAFHPIVRFLINNFGGGIKNRTTALRVSGLDWSVVKPCVKWMEPFYEVVKADSSNLFLPELDEQLQASFGLRHISTHINTDDSYVIQTHTTSVALFVSI